MMLNRSLCVSDDCCDKKIIGVRTCYVKFHHRTQVCLESGSNPDPNHGFDCL